MRLGLDVVAALLVFAGLSSFSSNALAAGDASRGEAQAAACAACHGADGATGLDPTYPNLAGQNEKYLLRQLEMIQSGERNVLLMAGQLNGKSVQDLGDLAAYYASLPGKIGQSEGDDETVDLAGMIYRGGMAGRGVAACSACHNPSGGGNAQAGYPRVSGQPNDYTIAQLTAYREGERRTDESFGAMMRGVARGLTDGEIRALADYLQGLH